jgi:hypothetical protein
MLLAVGGIMQWLAMIAILVAQNAQGNVQDKQVEHLHQLGVTTHKLVVENTELTEAIHDHFIKNNARLGGPRSAFAPSRHCVAGVAARQHLGGVWSRILGPRAKLAR